jgi:hypothetical protein
MKFFLDTEFYEQGYARIDLISIALVCEDGREFYAVAKDGWSPANVSDWHKDNVLPYLGDVKRLERGEIAEQLKSFVREQDKPEFVGYFADYDWVLFCQLFGRMIDLPEHFPKYCLDIKQMMVENGIKKSDLPKQDEQEHNALADARHMKKMFEFITRTQ